MRNEKSGYPTKANARLWIAQWLLAALFLFAGVMKLVMPIELLTQDTTLPGLFLRFIGVAEALGALGLVLPGLLRIHTGLTPLAAAGLVVIMIGATAVTLAGGQGAAATVPAVVGLLSAYVARGRSRERSSLRLHSSPPPFPLASPSSS